ncbi:MAG: hypothetical protein ACD_4C00479G0002, partial [uncultured bacterium (gcode 4)]
TKTWLDLTNYKLYNYKNEILLLRDKQAFEEIKKRLYFIKLWKKIWKIEKWEFIPNYYIWRDFDLPKTQKYEIKDQLELDDYLRWVEINPGVVKPGMVQIQFDKINIWLGFVSNEWKIKNIFPKIWLRK